ncbi:MAG: DUF169 domain-containing protein [Candidatus Lokiarchaeota archaeon]|nr:DUF169 domain-containing protein [Candidatus Lokiarchaeota archaeon]
MDLKQVYNMSPNPVGVTLIFENKNIDYDKELFKKPEKMDRYCNFVKRASNGEYLKIRNNDFSCVTGEIMLGFKKPKHIVLDMRLDYRGLKYVLLYPINEYNIGKYDCVILIVNPMICMDIIEAYKKIYKKPLNIVCGTISGICSEITAYVIKRDDINFSFLCSGSRIYTGFDDSELLCGIPFSMTNEIISEMLKIRGNRKLDYELARNC